jgi:hypothetical protein
MFTPRGYVIDGAAQGGAVVVHHAMRGNDEAARVTSWSQQVVSHCVVDVVADKLSSRWNDLAGPVVDLAQD